MPRQATRSSDSSESVKPARARDGERELERDAASRELLVRIGAAGLVRVHDDGAVRELASGEVMVGDDDVDSRRARARDALESRHAAVHGDDTAGRSRASTRRTVSGFRP